MCFCTASLPSILLLGSCFGALDFRSRQQYSCHGIWECLSIPDCTRKVCPGVCIWVSFSVTHFPVIQTDNAKSTAKKRSKGYSGHCGLKLCTDEQCLGFLSVTCTLYSLLNDSGVSIVGLFPHWGLFTPLFYHHANPSFR